MTREPRGRPQAAPRPTLDVEALREKVVAAMPWYDESNPDYTDLDAVLLAAYQPTGPDDLAGLLGDVLFEDALSAYRKEVTREKYRSDPGARATWHRMARRIVDALSARGVTLTGVRSSECRCADGHPDPAGLAAGTALHALGCPAGVRSSEVDGLRHEDDSYGGCVVCRQWTGHEDEFVVVPFPCPTVRLAALTGDTGPKVEPEPCEHPANARGQTLTGHGLVDYCALCGWRSDRATPEPTNDD